MKELEQILKTHAAAYPEMQPADVVKLIYQNEFGGGHLISDSGAALRYLRREYDTVERDPASLPAEKIGGGMLRVNLAAITEEQVDKLGEAFLQSAAEHKGEPERFLQKLEVLRRLTAGQVFAFDTGRLEAYLADYAAAGYPMVSHSDAYRQAYKPAYRVVLARLWNEE